jgi:hypothetical protein
MHELSDLVLRRLSASEELALFADRTSTELMRSNPIAVVLFYVCLSTAAGFAAVGFGGHGNGPGAMPNDTAEVAEDGCADAGPGTAGGALTVQRLSATGDCLAAYGNLMSTA